MNINSIGEFLFDVFPGIKKLGGAPFNFIYHVNKFTGKGNFISRIGDDDFGNNILEYLNSKNISVEFIQKDKIHQTGIAKVEIDKNHTPHFTIVENCAYDFIEFIEDQFESIKSMDLLYFGTLAQRNKISRDTIRKLISSFKGRIFCDLNLRQNFFSKDILNYSLSVADIVKVNEGELKIINELFFNLHFDIQFISKRVMDHFNIKFLCVTLGEKGSYIFDENNFSFVKAKDDKIIDSVGAGDAFSAILCLGILHNFNLEKINELASQFAFEICQIQGALPEDEKFYKQSIFIN